MFVVWCYFRDVWCGCHVKEVHHCRFSPKLGQDNIYNKPVNAATYVAPPDLSEGAKAPASWQLFWPYSGWDMLGKSGEVQQTVPAVCLNASEAGEEHPLSSHDFLRSQPERGDQGGIGGCSGHLESPVSLVSLILCSPIF